MRGFLAELKRREVVKVGIAYAATGWIVVQIAGAVFTLFEAPLWVIQVLTTLVVLGFPVVLILAWVFELTADGLKRTPDVAPLRSATPQANRRLDLIIIALLIVAVGLFAVDRLILDKPDVDVPSAVDGDVADPFAPENAASGQRDSIAVLPFVNIGSDPEQQFLVDGLTEELLNRLARIPLLKVPARTSSFYYQGKTPEMREVGKALGVGTVLEGSVRRSGDRLRITAQLIDVNTVTKAEELFRQATRRDMGYAAAFTGLADTYLSQYDYGMISWEDSTVKARAAATKALELDENLAEGHVSLAHILMHEWQWQKADREFQRAIELNPNYVVAYHWYALCFTALGRVDEAVRSMQRAIELDPVSTRINADLGMAFLAAGRYAEAVAQEERTLELAPQATTPKWIRGIPGRSGHESRFRRMGRRTADRRLARTLVCSLRQKDRSAKTVEGTHRSGREGGSRVLRGIDPRGVERKRGSAEVARARRRRTLGLGALPEN